MISLDFAPNEEFDDSLKALKLLFQPSKYYRGKEIKEVSRKLLKNFKLSRLGININLFFTGRSALFNLLRLLKLNKGDEIIVQAFTCEAVVLPIKALNLKPVFVDINYKDFSINPIDFKKKITYKTKVVILQHTFGITPTHRDKILSIIRERKLVLIEDIAHGIDFDLFKKAKAPLDSKHYLVLSFGRTKFISSVFGGGVIGKNKRIYQEMKKITLPKAPVKTIVKALLYKALSPSIKMFYDIFIGKLIHKASKSIKLFPEVISKKEKGGEFDYFFNKKYPNVLASLLDNQLRKLRKINKQRERIVHYYQAEEINKKILLKNYNLIRFPLLVRNRGEVIREFKKKGIFLAKWYDQVVAPKALNLRNIGYKKQSCPVAERLSEKIINLPTNVSLLEAKKIVSLLKRIVKY